MYSIEIINMRTGEVMEFIQVNVPRFTHREYKLIACSMMDWNSIYGKDAQYLTAYVYAYDIRKDYRRSPVLRFDLNSYQDITSGDGSIISAEICEHARLIRDYEVAR